MADYQYIPRAMGLLDALCTSVPQGMTAITNANGINTLVGAVKVGSACSVYVRELNSHRQKWSFCSPILCKVNIRSL
jgi:hypothetical protein